jgi:phosphoribosylformylglycinamidine cyclo-ligase
MISGKDVAPGQGIVAVREVGFRSNGFSLVRRVFCEKYGKDWHTEKFNSTTLGNLVLEPSRIFTPLITSLTGGYNCSPVARIGAIAHITGGGVPGKLRRALLPSSCGALLPNLFEPCPAMAHCQSVGNIADREAYAAWNMGNGLLVITSDPTTTRLLN